MGQAGLQNARARRACVAGHCLCSTFAWARPSRFHGQDWEGQRKATAAPWSGSPEGTSQVPAAGFDNVEILKAIDDRQQQNEGRKLRLSAHQLLNEISGTFAADPRLMPGFLQELFIAQAAGQLTWRLMDQSARPIDANYYLQQIQDLALTTAGQDRARNRMVQLPPPDPDEDDGHDLSDLILQARRGRDHCRIRSRSGRDIPRRTRNPSGLACSAGRNRQR